MDGGLTGVLNRCGYFPGLAVLLVALLLPGGCGRSTVSPEDETLSQIMALTNVSRAHIANDEGAITGVRVSVDVVNIGLVSVTAPFVMTWRLRDADGNTLATATRRFAQLPFQPAETRTVTLVLTFDPRADLNGVQDVVTFAFESDSAMQRSPAAMAGAGVLVMSSGGPWSTCT